MRETPTLVPNTLSDTNKILLIVHAETLSLPLKTEMLAHTTGTHFSV